MVNYYVKNSKLRFEPHEVFKNQSAAPTESTAWGNPAPFAPDTSRYATGYSRVLYTGSVKKINIFITDVKQLLNKTLIILHHQHPVA